MLAAVGVLIALSGGCGRSGPTLAGGKPIAHWVQALADPDAKVRKTAAFKLGNVGPADPAALPALLHALGDRDPAVRREVILALLKFDAGASDVVPALEAVRQRDDDATVRDYAGKALAKLQALPDRAR